MFQKFHRQEVQKPHTMEYFEDSMPGSIPLPVQRLLNRVCCTEEPSEFHPDLIRARERFPPDSCNSRCWLQTLESENQQQTRFRPRPEAPIFSCCYKRPVLELYTAEIEF